MDWTMMTDQSSGVFRLTNIGRAPGIVGRGTWYYYIHDLDTNVFNNSPAPVQETVDALAGPGDDLDGNQFGVWRLRSAQYSTIYYNPEIEYQPWRGLNRNNNDFENAPPTAAPLDPFDNSAQTIDLTATHDFTSRFVPMFRNVGTGRRNLVNSNVYFPYYYTTPVAGRPAWNAPRTKITIDDPAATYPGGLSRLDCAENDGDPTVCSYEEELQNFANWFTYYRSREYTSKAARVYSPGIYLRRVLDLLNIYFLIRFTKKPFRFFGFIGAVSSIVGGVIAAWTVFEKIFMEVPLADRPLFLIGTVLLIFGLQIILVGLIGEIIIFSSAKSKKEYVIDRIYHFADGESGSE